MPKIIYRTILLDKFSQFSRPYQLWLILIMKSNTNSQTAVFGGDFQLETAFQKRIPSLQHERTLAAV